MCCFGDITEMLPPSVKEEALKPYFETVSCTRLWTTSKTHTLYSLFTKQYQRNLVFCQLECLFVFSGLGDDFSGVADWQHIPQHLIIFRFIGQLKCSPRLLCSFHQETCIEICTWWRSQRVGVGETSQFWIGRSVSWWRVQWCCRTSWCIAKGWDWQCWIAFGVFTQADARICSKTFYLV